MGIFIKNPDVERKVRELAARRGVTMTAAIGEAVGRALAAEPAPNRRRPTVAEMREATDRFRRDTGLDQRTHRPVTKAEWDALWPTGVDEFDRA